MQLPWKASVQEPRYMRHWKSEQRHLDYWTFGLLLLVVLTLLYGLFVISWWWRVIF